MPSTLGSIASDAAAGTSFGPVGTLVGAGVGLISGLFGAGQRRRARKLAEQNAFPDEAIPQGVLDAEKIAEQDANTGLPSEQYNQARQNIARQQSQALSGANDRRSGLFTVAQNQQAGNDALLNLDVQNANARIMNRQKLIAAKENLGQWQDKTWQWNKKAKFEQTAAAARALAGAGNMNLNQGLDRIAGAATGYFGRGGGAGLFGSGGNVPSAGNVDPYGYDPQGTGTDIYNTTG